MSAPMIYWDVVELDFAAVPHTILQHKVTHSEGTTASTLPWLRTIAQVIHVSIQTLLDHKG